MQNCRKRCYCGKKSGALVCIPVKNLSALILGIMILSDNQTIGEIRDFLLKKNRGMGGKSPLEYLRDNDLSDKMFKVVGTMLRRKARKAGRRNA